MRDTFRRLLPALGKNEVCGGARASETRQRGATGSRPVAVVFGVCSVVVRARRRGGSIAPPILPAMPISSERSTTIRHPAGDLDGFFRRRVRTRTPQGALEKAVVFAPLSLITALSLAISDAGTVVAVTGSVCGSAIIYLFPAFIFFATEVRGSPLSFMVVSCFLFLFL